MSDTARVTTTKPWGKSKIHWTRKRKIEDLERMIRDVEEKRVKIKGRDPKELADMARKQGFKAHPRETIGQALAAIHKPGRALVFGSLYLAGEALAANGNVPD